MRKTVFIFCLMLLVKGLTLQAQSDNDIEAHVERLRKALVEADSTSLRILLHEKLTYGHSSGKIEDKAALVSSLTTGQSDFVTLDFSNVTIQLEGNTAIVRHILSAKINDNNKAGEVKLQVLLVWTREHNDWKLLARQAVKIL